MSDEKGPIPPRWLNCPRKAVDLIANKFLAFKTPLSPAFDNQVPEECRFYVDMVFQSLKSHKLKIGLWVDLTNTSRFYDKTTVEKHDCKYVKMQCRGYGETPSDEQITLFLQICKNFIVHNPLEIIGVHCTHGFNRTGFLIISYLVEEEGIGVDIAFSKFARARSPGIYKHEYIKELYKRYDEVRYAPPPPTKPTWYLEDDSNLNYGDEGPSTSGNSSRSTSGSPSGNTSGSTSEHNKNSEQTLNGNKRKHQFNNKNSVFMAGVPGVTSVSNKTKVLEIQTHVQEICAWKSGGFPGSQPVSMDLDNINLLNTKAYKVSWKADGTRYMMLIQEMEVYFIDRNNCVFQVNGISFPHLQNIKSYLKDTLVDGEMVIDKVEGRNIPRYLVYDVIMYNGTNVSQLPFHPDRYSIIDQKIIGGRLKAMQEGRLVKEREPFSVRLKTFWSISVTRNLLSPKFSNQLSHEPDGLIFQPAIDRYCPGMSSDVLKWKPVSLNSVDFRLKIIMESGKGILPRKIGHLYVGGLNIPYSTIKLTKELKELDNTIIECKYEDNQWIFMRQRQDKSFPNSRATADSVCKSILRPVTKEYLLNWIDKFIRDVELMPPPCKKHCKE